MQGAKVNADWEIPIPANAGQCVTVRKLVVLEAPVCTPVVTAVTACTCYARAECESD